MKTIAFVLLMLFSPLVHAEQYISIFADTTADSRSLSCTGDCSTLSAESKNTAGIGYGVYKKTGVVDFGLDLSVADTSALELRLRKRLGKFAIFGGYGIARMNAKTSVGSFVFRGQTFIINDDQDFDNSATRKTIGLSYDISKTHGVAFSYHRTEGNFDFTRTLVVGHHFTQKTSELSVEVNNYRITYLFKF